MDNFITVYLNNIIIFSERKENHDNHVHLVLQKFCKLNLYVKLSKCIFDTVEIEFLEFIMSSNGMTIDPERLDTIAK